MCVCMSVYVCMCGMCGVPFLSSNYLSNFWGLQMNGGVLFSLSTETAPRISTVHLIGRFSEAVNPLQSGPPRRRSKTVKKLCRALVDSKESQPRLLLLARRAVLLLAVRAVLLLPGLTPDGKGCLLSPM